MELLPIGMPGTSWLHSVCRAARCSPVSSSQRAVLSPDELPPCVLVGVMSTTSFQLAIGSTLQPGHGSRLCCWGVPWAGRRGGSARGFPLGCLLVCCVLLQTCWSSDLTGITATKCNRHAAKLAGKG